MERSKLQDWLGRAKFDGRTSYGSTVGSWKRNDRILDALPGAGSPSFKRPTPQYQVEPPFAVEQTGQPETDWAGNLVPANRRKVFQDRRINQTYYSNVTAQDGYLAPNINQKEKHSSRPFRYGSLTTSDQVKQESPDGVDPSQWKSSYSLQFDSSHREENEQNMKRQQRRKLVPPPPTTYSHNKSYEKTTIAMANQRTDLNRAMDDFKRIRLDAKAIANNLKADPKTRKFLERSKQTKELPAQFRKELYVENYRKY